MASFADDLFLFQGFGPSFGDIWGLIFAALCDAFNCGLADNMQESCLSPAISYT